MATKLNEIECQKGNKMERRKKNVMFNVERMKRGKEITKQVHSNGMPERQRNGKEEC